MSNSDEIDASKMLSDQADELTKPSVYLEILMNRMAHLERQLGVYYGIYFVTLAFIVKFNVENWNNSGIGFMFVFSMVGLMALCLVLNHLNILLCAVSIEVHAHIKKYKIQFKYPWRHAPRSLLTSLFSVVAIPPAIVVLFVIYGVRHTQSGIVAIVAIVVTFVFIVYLCCISIVPFKKFIKSRNEASNKSKTDESERLFMPQEKEMGEEDNHPIGDDQFNKAWERRDAAMVEHWLETYRSVLSMSVAALRVIVLINGGAIIAILAYLGDVAGQQGAEAALSKALVESLLWFVLGVALAAATTGMAYLVQNCLFGFLSNKKKMLGRVTAVLSWLAIFTWIGSTACFVGGALLCRSAFLASLGV